MRVWIYHFTMCSICTRFISKGKIRVPCFFWKDRLYQCNVFVCLSVQCPRMRCLLADTAFWLSRTLLYCYTMSCFCIQIKADWKSCKKYTSNTLRLKALKYFCINKETKSVFFQFELIINVLLSFFRFEYLCH